MCVKRKGGKKSGMRDRESVTVLCSIVSCCSRRSKSKGLIKGKRYIRIGVCVCVCDMFSQGNS